MSAVPVQKPIVITRPRPELRVEQGVRPKASPRVLSRVLLFGGLSLSVFLSSSLVGQVMLEQARREGIRAAARAKSAAKEEAVLRVAVQSMTSASAMDSWALAHGFVPPEEQASAQQGDSGAEADH